jgi:hypothetical protein
LAFFRLIRFFQAMRLSKRLPVPFCYTPEYCDSKGAWLDIRLPQREFSQYVA